jgi:predicted RNA-binding protein associated with RNAse of E/G family
VTIQYRRLPDWFGRFQGILLEESRDRLVIEQYVRVRNPRREFGRVVVANGYLAVWFIFKGKWYDVGKFYDRKGNFTGYYCDIIRPVARLLSGPSKTSVITDLFLDLWISREGRCVVLDEDDLDRALRKHTISASLARRARRELRNLIQLTKSGRFPTRLIRRFQPAMNASRS